MPLAVIQEDFLVLLKFNLCHHVNSQFNITRNKNSNNLYFPAVEKTNGGKQEFILSKPHFYVEVLISNLKGEAKLSSLYRQVDCKNTHIYFQLLIHSMISPIDMFKPSIGPTPTNIIGYIELI